MRVREKKRERKREGGGTMVEEIRNEIKSQGKTQFLALSKKIYKILSYFTRIG